MSLVTTVKPVSSARIEIRRRNKLPTLLISAPEGNDPRNDAVLPKLSLKIALLSFRFASLIKCIPFELSGKGELELKPMVWWKLWMYYGVNMMVYSSALFQLVTILYNLKTEGFTADCVVHVLIISNYSFGTLFHLSMFTGTDEAFMLMNHLNVLRKTIDKEVSGKRYWWSHPISWIMSPYFAYNTLVATPPLMTLVHLLQPEGAMYMYAYLPHSLKAMTGVKVGSALLEMSLNYWNFTMLNTVWVMWVVSIFQTFIWLQEIKESSKDHRLLEKCIESYRQTVLVNISHNAYNAGFFTPTFYGLVTVKSALYLYCILKAFRLVPIYVYMCFFLLGAFTWFLQFVFFNYHAIWGIVSPEVLGEMRKQVNLSQIHSFQEKELLLKEIRALRLIRNKIKSFGYTTVCTSKRSVEETFNYLLLLISF